MRFAEKKLVLVTNFTKIYILMKKVIAVLTLLLAFTINVNAQQDKKQDKKHDISNNTTAPADAKNDAAILAKLVELTPTEENTFTRLFTKKYRILDSPESTEDEKNEIVKAIDGKIRATLTDKQMKKLEENPDVYAKMTGAALRETQSKK